MNHLPLRLGLALSARPRPLPPWIHRRYRVAKAWKMAHRVAAVWLKAAMTPPRP